MLQQSKPLASNLKRDSYFSRKNKIINWVAVLCFLCSVVPLNLSILITFSQLNTNSTISETYLFRLTFRNVKLNKLFDLSAYNETAVMAYYDPDDDMTLRYSLGILGTCQIDPWYDLLCSRTPKFDLKQSLLEENSRLSRTLGYRYYETDFSDLTMNLPYNPHSVQQLHIGLQAVSVFSFVFCVISMFSFLVRCFRGMFGKGFGLLLHILDALALTSTVVTLALAITVKNKVVNGFKSNYDTYGIVASSGNNNMFIFLYISIVFQVLLVVLSFIQNYVRYKAVNHPQYLEYMQDKLMKERARRARYDSRGYSGGGYVGDGGGYGGYGGYGGDGGGCGGDGGGGGGGGGGGDGGGC